MARLESPKKKRNNKLTLILLFSLTFIVTMLLVGAIFKNYSPPVDVNIGGEEIVQEDDEIFQEGKIDDRLKWIQFEDNIEESPVAAEVHPEENTVKKDFENANKRVEELEEIRPKFQHEEKKQPYITHTKVSIKPAETPPIPTISEIQKKNTVPVSAKMTRVYIGYYTTQDEAIKVRNSVSSSMPQYQPYIKNVNGQYIVQVASFADRNKAVNFKLELSDKGFPARLLSE